MKKILDEEEEKKEEEKLKREMEVKEMDDWKVEGRKKR